jgi:asparagine synthase (glutamine-hydrolysing)
MCGIAGVVTFDKARVAVAALKSMTDCMVNRGPDDDGFFADGAFGIGMRRLSIIDVAGGHQPLSNETDDIHLVFNGEIYNHVELRQQLLARGHRFKTGSDAETILHLYEDKGVDALRELNGMFGFALYDSRRQALWIARDRLGIKPLFYATTGGSIAFASDIRALRSAFPTEIDPRQVAPYLAFGYVPGSSSMWRGVQKLAPGHYLWIESGRVTTHRYWAIDSIGSWSGSAAAAREQLGELLADALRLELRSDVPLGMFLSGGLDSSSLTALAAEQLSEPLRTFTIQFDGKKSLDTEFARAVADRYRTRHTVIPMGAQDAATVLDELLPMMDEPVADSAFVPAYWLSKIARAEGVKVLLNGAGGDEIFGGYRRHSPPAFGSPTWVAERFPRPLRRVVGSVWEQLQPHRGLRATDPMIAWASTVSGVNLPAARSLLRDPGDFTSMLNAIHREFAPLASSNGGLAYAHRRMSLDIETYLPGDVLSLTDKATMAASVEARVPLLDHRVVEFALSLPAAINMPGGEAKGLFKQVMASRLPPALLHREKEGFNAPDDVWMRGDSGIDLSGELLGNRSATLDSLIRPVELERLLANDEKRKHAASLLFALFLFNRWEQAQR